MFFLFVRFFSFQLPLISAFHDFFAIPFLAPPANMPICQSTDSFFSLVPHLPPCFSLYSPSPSQVFHKKGKPFQHTFFFSSAVFPWSTTCYVLLHDAINAVDLTPTFPNFPFLSKQHPKPLFTPRFCNQDQPTLKICWCFSLAFTQVSLWSSIFLWMYLLASIVFPPSI